MKRIGISVVTALLLFAGLGCSSSSNDDGNSRVRVYHGSADAPAVDVLVDEDVVVSTLAYLEAAGYLTVSSGTRRVRVNAAGTDTTVIDAELNLQNGVAYTVIASGLLANISPLVLVDDQTVAPSGAVRVRVVHNAAGAPEVDVYVTEPGADLEDADPVLSNIPFTAVSDYLEVPEGTYQLRVTLAGTKDVAIDSGEVMLMGQQTRTVIASDAPGGGAPFSLQILEDVN